MQDTKQVVTKTEENGLDQDGAKVQQQTKRIQTASAADPKTTAQNAIWYLLGFIEILLGFRFVLKLLGANTTSGFTSFIYGITDLLTKPFDSIFGVTQATSGKTVSVFEPSILVAGIVYILIAWGIVKLVTINQKS